MQKNFGELYQQLILPCGALIKNRWMKSAMSEGMATVDHRATPELVRLYQTWAEGGAGLIVTGNVMVDRRALGEPRNVVLENEEGYNQLKQWTRVGTVHATHLWAQLNHPGKQSPKVISRKPVAPSAVPFEGNLAHFFAVPRAMSEQEILETIIRFGESARLAKEVGFTGVQIHGAHGYLVSQFLSPKHNVRQDEWGGTIDNRMRFLIEMYHQIRRQVGNEYPVGIKLNSADFQKGGFTEEESTHVIQTISKLGMDLIEISGGTYESPVMIGAGRYFNNEQSSRTFEREAYFIEFAQKIRKVCLCPIAVTGGFRTPEVMLDAVKSNATDMIGMARPFVLEPALPNKLANQEVIEINRGPILTGLPFIDKKALLETIWYEQQLARMGRGKPPQPKRSAWLTLIVSVVTTGWQVFQKRRSS